MFRKSRELIENYKKENRRLRKNNELLGEQNVKLLKFRTTIIKLAKEQTYNSTINLQNKMKKTLAELDEQLESLN